jgi:hypothetical protein
MSTFLLCDKVIKIEQNGLLDGRLLFNCFPILFNSKQLIQATPGNLKKIPLPFVLFQEKRATIQTTAFQTVFVVAPIKDMQPATGAVKKNMATLL